VLAEVAGGTLLSLTAAAVPVQSAASQLQPMPPTAACNSSKQLSRLLQHLCKLAFESCGTDRQECSKCTYLPHAKCCNVALCTNRVTIAAMEQGVSYKAWELDGPEHCTVHVTCSCWHVASSSARCGAISRTLANLVMSADISIGRSVGSFTHVGRNKAYGLLVLIITQACMAP
jgi:hypothetical protein